MDIERRLKLVDTNPAVRIFLARRFKKRALRGLIPEALPAISAITGTTRGASESLTSSNARRARGCRAANRSTETSTEGEIQGDDSRRSVPEEIPVALGRDGDRYRGDDSEDVRAQKCRPAAARVSPRETHVRALDDRTALPKRRSSAPTTRRSPEEPSDAGDDRVISRREIDAQVRIVGPREISEIT